MKLGGPIQRRTPLPRTPMPRRAHPDGGGLTVPTPAKPPLKKVSTKRAAVNRERTKMLREARLYPQICVVPWCDQVGDSPHEPLTRARGGSITDPDNVVMICWPHNQELTLEPAWGYELGFLRHSWDGAA